jgi:D-glycero-D-manno-heptose 1,7-bisphosphate phosphatase
LINKAVFLDRDGTVNHLVNGHPPWSFNNFKLFSFSSKAIKLLKKIGFKVFIVSNQPDVVDGKMDIAELLKIDNKLYSLGIDGVCNCLHRDSSKYKPGNKTIEDIINTYSVDRNSSYMVGDRDKDIIAGHKSGLKCLYVGPKVYPFSDYDLSFDSLESAVNYIKEQK